jgi:hypothetical protein
MTFRISTVLFLAIFGINSYAHLLFYSQPAEDDRIVLTNSDKKKLEKADKETQKSKDLLQEADKIYADNASKQSEMTAEESEKQNNKALVKQIEALKVLQSAENITFGVYSAKADEFWKKFKGNPDDMSYAKSLESNARINFKSAQDQYKDAEDKTDKLIRYSTMTTASELSGKSIDDIKKAFDIYSNTSLTQASVSQPVVQPVLTDTVTRKKDTIIIPAAIIKPVKDTSSSNIYRSLKINEDMVDKFNKYMKETYPANYEKYIIDFTNLNYSDVESLRASWYRYLYGEETPLAETGSTDTTKKQTDSSLMALNNNSKIPGSNVQTGETYENKEVLGKLKKKIRKTTDGSTETGQSINEEPGTQRLKSGKRIIRSAEDYVRNYSDTTIVKGFTFRVQIVASRVPLNDEFMKAIYQGSEQPEENYENEWYKYSVGPFANYAMARQFREQCMVHDAFIVALLNGKKINSNEALILPDQNSNTFTNFNISENIIFKVQVAACHNEMTVEELRKIYEKAEELESTSEEGWYKYSINCGNSYSKACDLLKNIRVAGAFISAYRDGQRVELKSIFNEVGQPAQ